MEPKWKIVPVASGDVQQMEDAHARDEIFSGLDAAILRKIVTIQPLHPISTSTDEVVCVLKDGLNTFLGSGAFSWIYAINKEYVFKFSHDRRNLELLKRLGEKSNYFPRVEILLDAQAIDNEGNILHAAKVERLIERKPKWVRHIIDNFRVPTRCNSPLQAHIRLLEICVRINEGKVALPENESAALIAALKILADECIDWKLIPDLRTDLNIMTRSNGHVVLADPAHPMDLMGNYGDDAPKLALDDLDFRPRVEP